VTGYLPQCFFIQDANTFARGFDETFGPEVGDEPDYGFRCGAHQGGEVFARQVYIDHVRIGRVGAESIQQQGQRVGKAFPHRFLSQSENALLGQSQVATKGLDQLHGKGWIIADVAKELLGRHETDLGVFQGHRRGVVGLAADQRPVADGIAAAGQPDDEIATLAAGFKDLDIAPADAEESRGMVALAENQLALAVYFAAFVRAHSPYLLIVEAFEQVIHATTAVFASGISVGCFHGWQYSSFVDIGKDACWLI